MGINLDLTNVGDPTKIHSGGLDLPAPGRGMVIITDFSEHGEQNGRAHGLTMEVVGWTDPTSVGKSTKELIWANDTTGKGHPAKRMTALGLAAGLFNHADIKSWQAAGVQPDLDYSKIVGRPIMVILHMEKDKDSGREFLKVAGVGLDFYHVSDPKTKDWPRNQGLLNRLAAEVGEFDGATDSKPATTPAAPATGPADPFAGKV
jgi:hypothetical protein